MSCKWISKENCSKNERIRIRPVSTYLALNSGWDSDEIDSENTFVGPWDWVDRPRVRSDPFLESEPCASLTLCWILSELSFKFPKLPLDLMWSSPRLSLDAPKRLKFELSDRSMSETCKLTELILFGPDDDIFKLSLVLGVSLIE